MGRAQRGLPEAPAVGDRPDAAPEAIGAYLSRQRRLRGISLDELAEITRSPRRSLERLESGAFDTEPDGFVRGFVRAVAGALGLSPEETIARMLPEVGAESDAVAGGALWRWAPRALAGALLVAALWWLWPRPEPPPLAGAPDPDLIYRRDAVRELADENP